MKKLLFILTLCGYISNAQTLLPVPSTPTTANINSALGGALAASGTNSYAATLTGLTTYTGFAADIQFTNANTSTTTSLSINGMSGKSLKKYSSGSLVDLAVGDIQDGSRIRFYYNGSALVMMGGSGTASNDTTSFWKRSGWSNVTNPTISSSSNLQFYGSRFKIGSEDSPMNFDFYAPGNSSITSEGTLSLNAVTPGSTVNLSSNNSSGEEVVLQIGSAANGTVLTDNRTAKSGIQYAANYSSGFTNRSLVDKAYVDAAVSGGGFADPLTTNGDIIARVSGVTTRFPKGSNNTFLGVNGSGTLGYSAVNLTTGVTGTLPVANGGTGTTTPGLVAGTNVTITGTWPNQTINASGSGSSALSSLTAATGSNTINNVANAQEWQWNSLTSGTGFKLSSSSTAATSTGGLITSGLGTLTPGTSYTTGVYTGVSLTGGTGTGAIATISVGPYTGLATPIGVVSVVITTPGIGYVVGDNLSASAASIGGTGSGFSIAVSYVSGDNKVLSAVQTGANSNSSIVTQAGYFSNTKTGSSGKNIGLYTEASGAATKNYAIQAKGEINIPSIGSQSKNIFSVEAFDGKQFGNFNFTLEEGTVNADGQRDAVFEMGWNISGSGGTDNVGIGSGNAAMWESWERHYLPFGILGVQQANFERHFQTNGLQIISILGTITGGSSYTTGTYTGVALTGGSGVNAKATIVVAGGAVTSVTITSPGTGYLVGDNLSASAANIGGTGSGFSVPVASLSTPTTRVSSYNVSKFIGQTDATKYFITSSHFNTIDQDEWRVASTAAGNSPVGTSYFTVSPNTVSLNPVNGATTTILLFEPAKTTQIAGNSTSLAISQQGQADDIGQFRVNGLNQGMQLDGSGSNLFGLTINNSKASNAVNSGITFQLQSTQKAIIEFAGSTNANADFANNLLFYVAPSTSGFTWFNNFGVAAFLSSKGNLQLGTSAGHVTDAARFYIKDFALTSAWLPALRVDPAAHTSMTAGTEFNVNVFTGSTQTWANGSATLATQRYTWIKGPTVNAGSGNTFTDTYTVSIDDPTNGSGTTTNLWSLGVGKLRMGGVPKFAGTNTTGAGSAALGSNSPATTNTAPYTWIQITTSDGSTAYIPAWK